MSEKEPAVLQKNVYLNTDGLNELFKALQVKAAWAENTKMALEKIRDEFDGEEDVFIVGLIGLLNKCLAEYPNDDK